ITRVRTRLAYLIKLWNQGIRFDTLVFHGSQRPRDPQVEPERILLNNNVPDLPINAAWQFSGSLPATEYDMIRMVIEQTEFPAAMVAIPKIVIDCPMLPTANGSLVRPTTGDVVTAWLATKPQPGSCLCISNQPYVGYQDAVVATLVPSTFTTETVGPVLEQPEKIAVVLDSVARWLYQEQQRRKA
ncbi:MAG TPA: hypothetical protein VLG71_03635, partial [Candidatus Limnocylindria bacterium]|nr:hypothetical protein [Candidatus Limnocylindria bacterium]